MNAYKKPPTKTYYIIFLAVFFSLIFNKSFASELSEDWSVLGRLSGEKRRKTQSLICKRKHFNNLVKDKKYDHALEYSKGILQNKYHTSRDETVFKDVKRGLQSVSSMKDHFHSKVKEKDYDYSLTYLREKIIFHPFHDENDKRLTKFVKNQKKKDRKKELEQLGDDIGVLSDLMKKTCHVTSNNKNEGKKEKPYLSGIPCYSYINDLLPSQR